MKVLRILFVSILLFSCETDNSLEIELEELKTKNLEVLQEHDSDFEWSCSYDTGSFTNPGITTIMHFSNGRTFRIENGNTVTEISEGQGLLECQRNRHNER